jgi:phenylacetate-coenzyme A ligase PaaK-like adenylate-forming protein
VLDTALAQLRFAASLIFGVPFGRWSLDRLVDAVADTRREFGAIDAAGAEGISGPALDEVTRQDLQLRRFRTQAGRAARETAYYADVFARLGLDPTRLRSEDISRIPVTSKDALRDDPDAFVRRSGQPVLRTATTGTTGAPTAVAFSEEELHLIVSLTALGLQLQGTIAPDDNVQISTSARAVLGNLSLAGASARIGALVSLVGVIEPERTLALLAERRRVAGKKPRVSVLSIYPSYLGELVEHGSRLGYRPDDFGLERIAIGGEIVTAGLKARAEQVFGPVQFVENYAMTETAPFGGTLCAHGHLHFEVSHGLLEALDSDTGAPAQPGEVGTIVATPFPPFRQTTLLLRYDTQDAVRTVPGPLTCNLRHLPATTNLLGKLRLAARHERGWTFPREVFEALEAVDAVPLPARCGYWAVPRGLVVEVVVREDTAAARRAIEHNLEERGVPLRELHLVTDRAHLRRPLPLRGDLKESSFGPTAPHPSPVVPVPDGDDPASVPGSKRR